MPAAAVIPAPIAYINVVAVKKLVVGFRDLWLCRAPAHCGSALVAVGSTLRIRP